MIKKYSKKIEKNISALVVGCGSIGERHLYNLKKAGVQSISIFDVDKTRTNSLAKKYDVTSYSDLELALDNNPLFTVVCTYPWNHEEIVKLCIKTNSHVFVEKPLSSSIDNMERLLERAKYKKLKVAVGYNLRFDQSLNFLKNKIKSNEIGTPLHIHCECGYHIKYWRNNMKYKNHYILKKGGGIILDDSHEYDYLRWLLDDDVISVYCVTKKSSLLKTESESIATMILKFRKGTMANIVMDYLRPKYERNCHVIGEKGDIRWNLNIEKGSSKNYDAKSISSITSTQVNTRVSLQKNFSTKLNMMYLMEMKDFIYSIIDDRKPLVDGWEGLKTLKIGSALLKSSKTGRIIKL